LQAKMSSSFAIFRDGRYSKFPEYHGCTPHFWHPFSVSIDSNSKILSYFDN